MLVLKQILTKKSKLILQVVYPFIQIGRRSTKRTLGVRYHPTIKA